MLVFTEQRARWAPELFGHFGEEKNLLPLPQFELQIIQPIA
jgi:hypothetical protein